MECIVLLHRVVQIKERIIQRIIFLCRRKFNHIRQTYVLLLVVLIIPQSLINRNTKRQVGVLPSISLRSLRFQHPSQSAASDKSQLLPSAVVVPRNR